MASERTLRFVEAAVANLRRSLELTARPGVPTDGIFQRIMELRARDTELLETWEEILEAVIYKRTV